MADSKDFSAEKPDVSCLKAKVRQLLWRDPHQLYQRLEAIVKDCVLEQKVKLIKLLKSQAKNPSLAQDFIQSKFAYRIRSNTTPGFYFSKCILTPDYHIKNA